MSENHQKLEMCYSDGTLGQFIRIITYLYPDEDHQDNLLYNLLYIYIPLNLDLKNLQLTVDFSEDKPFSTLDCITVPPDFREAIVTARTDEKQWVACTAYNIRKFSKDIIKDLKNKTKEEFFKLHAELKIESNLKNVSSLNFDI